MQLKNRKGDMLCQRICNLEHWYYWYQYSDTDGTSTGTNGTSTGTNGTSTGTDCTSTGTNGFKHWC